jgi:S-formylglutathione hydrolase FrmB
VRSPSRRAVLLGGVAAAAACVAGGYELVQDGVLPGKYALARLDGACGSAPPAPAGPPPGRQSDTFYSSYRRRQVQVVTLRPHNADQATLGLTIALHGSGGSAASMADQVAAAMTSTGITAFAVICVDGGDTYWHPRADGDDPVGMILHEVLARAAAAGLSTSRIGITGLSMGGYGALLLAERLAGAVGTVPSSAAARTAAPRAAAVAAMSPAIFASYQDARAANGGSFDSAADFARNNVVTGLAALRAVPTWIACGADDPFEPETSQLLSRLAAISGHRVPGGILAGCHDNAFWARTMPAALRFIGTRLG